MSGSKVAVLYTGRVGGLTAALDPLLVTVAAGEFVQRPSTAVSRPLLCVPRADPWVAADRGRGQKNRRAAPPPTALWRAAHGRPAEELERRAITVSRGAQVRSGLFALGLADVELGELVG